MTSTQGTLKVRLNPPERVDHHALCVYDLLKWGFKAPSDGTVPGYYLTRGGKMVRQCPIFIRHTPLRSNNISASSGGASSSSSGSWFPHHHAPRQVVNPIRAEQDMDMVAVPGSSREVEILLHDISRISVYTVSVTLPNGQTLQVNVDSGSSGSWLFGIGYHIVSDKQPSSDQLADAPEHRTFDPERSPSAVCTGPDRFRIDYVDETHVGGTVWRDAWTFKTYQPGGPPGRPLRVPFKFGIANEISLGLQLSKIDGVLGLGYSPSFPSVTNSDSFIMALPERNPGKLFKFYLCLNKTEPFMCLGEYPSIPVPTVWHYAPRRSYQWKIGLGAVGCGNLPSDANFQKHQFSSTISVLIDSGTNFCYLPRNSVKFLHEKLGGRKGSRGFEIPCGSSAQARPKVWFGFVIDRPESLAWYPWGLREVLGDITQGETSSRPAWYESRLRSQGDSDTSILGAAFLESFHVFFETGQNGTRIGFLSQTG